MDEIDFRGAEIDYLAFRFWINAWTALILFIMVATDASALVSYITRFTEESFATLIAMIFIVEAVVKLAKIGSQSKIAVYAPVSTLLSSPVSKNHFYPSVYNYLRIASNKVYEVSPNHVVSEFFSKR
ncbi:MAG: hypothetical protein GY696_09000 [Gammaproteobacteria bacterium]|nr:hypothetical protein [Gammaproteobacteria bacterium]